MRIPPSKMMCLHCGTALGQHCTRLHAHLALNCKPYSKGSREIEEGLVREEQWKVPVLNVQQSSIQSSASSVSRYKECREEVDDLISRASTGASNKRRLPSVSSVSPPTSTANSRSGCFLTPTLARPREDSGSRSGTASNGSRKRPHCEPIQSRYVKRRR